MCTPGDYVPTFPPLPMAFPPGFWDGEKGSEEWGRRNGLGKAEGRLRFHGIKQKDKGKGKDNYGVNPDTGDVINGQGEDARNLGDAKPK